MRICVYLKFLLLQQINNFGQGQILYKYRENYNTSLKLLIFTT